MKDQELEIELKVLAGFPLDTINWLRRFFPTIIFREESTYNPKEKKWEGRVFFASADPRLLIPDVDKMDTRYPGLGGSNRVLARKILDELGFKWREKEETYWFMRPKGGFNGVETTESWIEIIDNA